MIGLPEYVVQALVVLTMINTIISMELIKKKNCWGWYVSIGNQALWLAVNIERALWAFILLNIYLTLTSIHAIRLWSKKNDE